MTIDQIGREMPFKEDKAYVDQLLMETTERTIRSQRTTSRRQLLRRFAAILVFMLTVGSTGWIYIGHQKAKLAPLDTFLDNMTEEELAMLQDYCTDEALTSEWEWDDSDIYRE